MSENNYNQELIKILDMIKYNLYLIFKSNVYSFVYKNNKELSLDDLNSEAELIISKLDNFYNVKNE